MSVVREPDQQAARIVESVLGCKWTLSILDQLERGVRRPGQLQRSIPGLSVKVLNERLKKLQHFELIARRLVSRKPLHVAYRLTRSGQALVAVVHAVRRFATRHRQRGGG